jgi:nitrogen fixation protein NifQ
MSALLDLGRLLDGARDPSDVVTQALSGVLARFRLHGLAPAELARLRERYFPRVFGFQYDAGGCTALPADEVEDLLGLLLEHRSDDSDETRWLAHAVAAACAGDNHLWQDMGLPDREALSSLMRTHFTALHEKNSGNMKWKKFFYKQLCERAEVNLCKAPSCGVCSDYANCFGPEEGVVDSARPPTA